MAQLFLKKFNEVVLKKKSILILTLALNGCCIFSTSKINFSPDTLPVAVVGKNYHEHINTTGLPISVMYVNYKDSYIVNGLKIMPSTTTKVSRWYIDISGIPEKKGTFSFWAYGSTVGTQWPGDEFRKKFTLTVIDQE